MSAEVLTEEGGIGIFRIVGAERFTDREQPSGHSPTLGDVLYAKPSKSPLLESDWVKLVQAIGTGDQKALYTLYERAHRLVFTLAFRMTNSRETADELTVDVFHDVWRRAASYDPAGGPVLGWIMNQARSRTIDRLRFDQRKKRVNTSGEEPVTATPEKDPQQVFHAAEQTQLLYSALAVLSAEERQAIETAYFFGTYV